MKPTADLPDDPALPGLTAIRASGVRDTLPDLGLDDNAIEVLLCGYSPGERATLGVRAGPRRLAVKAYARDPAGEAALYKALESTGLVAHLGVRVRGQTGGVLDESALIWHQATALVRLASKPVGVAGGERLQARRKPEPRALAIVRARALLDEAALVGEPFFRDHDTVEQRIRARLPTLAAHSHMRAETLKDQMQPSTERIE